MKNISFIVIVRNDLLGFISTCNSIVPQLKIGDELIVVDGSDSNEIQIYLSNTYSKIMQIKYFQDNKSGIFSAQNLGLKEANKEWVCVINSGDYLKLGGRDLIDLKLCGFDSVDCHIFCQDSIDKNNKYLSTFTPNNYSLWPHQSIILRRTIHINYGYYNEKFKYSGEQYFFSNIRKKINYLIHKEVLTEYLVGGLSDAVNLQHCNEQYIVRRNIGNGVYSSFYKSYVTPILRKLTVYLFGDYIALKIKLVIYKHHRREKIK